MLVEQTVGGLYLPVFRHSAAVDWARQPLTLVLLDILSCWNFRSNNRKQNPGCWVSQVTSLWVTNSTNRPIELTDTFITKTAFKCAKIMLISSDFLANVNLCSGSLYAIAVPSVVCLSVVCLWRWCTLLRRLKFSAIFLRHLVPWPSLDIHWKFYGDRPRGTPSVGDLNTRGVAKYSDL